MTRFLIQVALPLLAPFAIYILWLWYAQKRAERHGNEPPAFTRGAAFISIMIGAVLAVISLVALALVSGDPPTSGAYQSPRLEGGRIVGPSYDGARPDSTAEEYQRDYND